VDCEIAICTSDVTGHFADNFDKVSFKDDYINWMQDNETLNDRIRVFEVKDQGSYVARILNPRLYSEITKDVLSRKAYPLVIDKYNIDSKSNYQNKMLNTYIE
jgi:hypothetical protein